MSAIQPLQWSVRRELWENRSIYLGPVVVAGLYLFGFAMSTIGMPDRRRATLLLEPVKQRAVINQPYDAAAMFLFLAAMLIGAFYCIDALYGERRDRSILFWKSLPVSDLTTVLSKASIPLMVLPAITFVVILATQFVMLLWSSVVLLQSGLAGTTWSRVSVAGDSPIVLYGLVTMALWHAPIYGWLILVSAWAKRVAMLWALLPVLGFLILDLMASRGRYFREVMRHRLLGGFDAAFDFKPNGAVDSLSQLTPGTFLTAPGLWGGLIVATLFLALAVRLRRTQEPI
jgi:ABC-2 type transport system permease protein